MSSLRQLAGRTLVVGYPAGGPPEIVLSALRDDALAGVILFRRNITTPLEVAREIALIADASSRVPLVAVDQEGGRVQRLGAPVLQLPPMRRLGDHDDPSLTRRVAHALGRQLDAIGFNVDFAPVLDVDTNPDNPVIGDRSFSRDPHVVVRHGLAFAEGLDDAGLLACGKHFPGHGDTVEDSHFDLPSLPHDLERLETVELVPFRAAAPVVGSLMTAHIVFSALDAERPATLSPCVITQLLREDMGYEGIVFSDDLEMKAIADHGSVGGAAVGAIRAGCDAVLICSKVDWIDEAVSALVAEAEADARFREQLEVAVARIDAARATLRCAPVTDADALAARLDEPLTRDVAEALAAL
ncbi:MAG: beta-N-acetylhexosaminidase [Sandaracinaceae bacterium]